MKLLLSLSLLLVAALMVAASPQRPFRPLRPLRVKPVTPTPVSVKTVTPTPVSSKTVTPAAVPSKAVTPLRQASELITSTTVCVQYVNATTSCRRNGRNFWIDVPILLALDDDMDTDQLLSPSAVYRYASRIQLIRTNLEIVLL